MELQQQLMEFVYGLLDEGEADVLRDRITSDPEVARAYAKVKLQCDLVARAARVDIPTVAWTRPDEGISSAPRPRTSAARPPRAAYRKFANWCLAAAASGVIGMVASAYWMSGSRQHDSVPVAMTAAVPLQVVLTGPSKLHTETGNPFTVSVESRAGTPVSTTLNYRVYDATGAVRWDDSASTDESGVVLFEVDAAVARDASRLEVTTGAAPLVPIARELETAPERFVTYLRMDRPLYQPGERVFYRSVTLRRFGLDAGREVAVAFQIVNANDEVVEGTPNTVTTAHGVGSGKFVLPSDMPEGSYTLIARSPEDLFREEWRDFQVRRYQAPQLIKKLELARDSYTVGDQVDVDFSVARVAGEPLAQVPLQIEATLDDLALAAPEVKTDAQGNARFSLTLPESIEQGKAAVSVTVQQGDDPAETIVKEIPINLGKVNVDFYPEGGELAAGLPSRVYFYGRDPLGEPTHIEGYLVDGNGDRVVNVATSHEGRGVFSFIPAASEQYRLTLETPAGATRTIPLPLASTDAFMTLDTGAGVFEAHAPIALTLYQQTPVKPLIVAAYCRGAMIGQATIDADSFAFEGDTLAKFQGEVPLAGQAQGVIRLTVFDATPRQPEPIAERLVYRRISRRLGVQLTPQAGSFAPGQEIRLDLSIRDEREAPVPAVLGISIVDDAVLNLADDKSTRMPTYFHLLTEIDSPEQLEDANFYLSEQPRSDQALDLLLATQGWRRFAEVPAMQFAQGHGVGFGGGFSLFNRDEANRGRRTFLADDAAIPLTTATTIDAPPHITRPFARPMRFGFSSQQLMASSLVAASIALLILVGVTSLHWARSYRWLRAFAVFVAGAALLAGMVRLPTKPMQTAQSSGEPAATEMDVAMADDEAKTADVELFGLGEEQDADRAQRFMYRSKDATEQLEALRETAPIESARSERSEAPPTATPRFGTPEALGRSMKEAGAVPEEAEKRTVGKDSKAARPAPAAQPLSAPEPSLPQPKAGAVMRRSLGLGEHVEVPAEQPPRRLLAREYAKWYFESPSNVSAPDQSSSTIRWHPHFVADDAGAAAVYFTLPKRPSSFRAIVEAHGADRLGAGELIINAR